MGGCSSQSLCLGHESNHCQARLLPGPSDIHKQRRQTVPGSEHNGLKLSSDDLEKITSAWNCQDIGSMTKQSDGESKEINKLEIVTDDISNIKHDSLHQFWLSLGRNCRRECGTGQPWQTVTEIKEVTETVITEVIEVIEFPVTQRRSEPKKTATAGILLCHKQSVEDPGQPCPPLASGPVDDDSESWINDIEDVETNQRPPSSELEVLKAQLQEEKLLRRLVEAHRPSMEAVTEGQQFGASENQAQAQNLPQRWQSLLQVTADRHSQLEKILSQTLQFQAVLDKLLNWLAVIERKFPISFPDAWENDDEIPFLE
ncbi:uncharacterized protein LOC125450554 [Stegostoma tigrinum]|uniref:uncharacterized protein LOC125450554 n=1 Tax=Stegostoma tigrinum TaxID=3053191 RepID=UPI00287029BD|nr:uncharacterized protein LOC125450554 [Stegostoma tigrinum]